MWSKGNAHFRRPWAGTARVRAQHGPDSGSSARGGRVPTMQAAASRHRVEYFDVSFGPGPLLMRVEASACFRHLEVAGFGVDEEGNPGPAERSGRVHTGDVVLGVNGQLFRGATFDEAMGRIAAATRPITLHFAREHGTAAPV